ncbi:MAG: hypothetical protein ACOC8N_06645 [Spirochaetota bacterium]
MKITRVVLSLSLLCAGIVFAGGCASTGGIKEPATSQSTLLIGRVTVTCREFPRDWKVNGEHTSGITVYLVDGSTRELIKLRCSGRYGLFCLVDPKAAQYVLLGFELEKKTGRMTFKGSYTVEKTYFDVTPGAVNNLGDLEWVNTYQGRKERGGGSAWYESTGVHRFALNYPELETWFRSTYPESAWNSRTWSEVAYRTF